MTEDKNTLSNIRVFFQNGKTIPYPFRLDQLKALKKSLEENEQLLTGALYNDLKKSETEAYLTEFGLLLSELKLAIKNLRKWMKPKRVKTNLVNLPSSSYLYPYPKGVVLIIGAWNYPLLLSLAPVIGAMAAGNCIVLKPSEHAPATAAAIEKIFKENFDENYIRIVQGEGSIVVPELMKQIHFDHIFYTGSGMVGKAVYELAAKNLIPVTLELGGKSPAIVEKDANIKIAARRIVFGKYMNVGQTCVAPDYVLVHEDVQEQLVAALKKSIHDSFGVDKQQSVDYGRIINHRQFDRLVALIENAEGEIVEGGNFDRDNLFIAPTIVKNTALTSPLMQEEIFGPVLPIISFREREDALNIVALHPNPLAFYLFTSNKKIENEWLTKVSFGNGCINNTVQHLANPCLPFGGVGQSGIGAYKGESSFRVFTTERAIMKTPTWFDPSIKYPPYRNKLKWLKKFL
ncbi:MAG TPA: aldehyde dehydrogenase [Niabella sp.]|nr:aldehyde dehydrogenase [Chitinophagaceae bacterium]HRO86001.1 aldehyde dehydrogenase [Niabella sp.]HUN02519.1 aldehyde dehydrogenase [Niabella sp.]